MIYRRRASPLHATRAGVAIAWCFALGMTALVESNPLLLGAVCVSVLGAGALAGVWSGVLRALRWVVPLALLVCLINALITRDGLTVIWRFGNLPVVGETNVTLEATVYGAVLGLRAAVLVLIGVLYSLAVDPDDVLRMLRRVSFRSALTATIATRMVPVLMRDSRRLADAQRTRSGPPPGRFQVVRATTSGVFDRALDIAATLEVRGYALGGRPAASGRPWSRHDIAFGVSAVLVLVVGCGARPVGLARFQAYPSLSVATGPGAWAAAALVLGCALFPFLDRRGIEL